MATGLDGFGPAGEFTIEDLERSPDDGRRYELLGGMLLVSPAPAQRPFPVTVHPADLVSGLRRAP